jgi:adenylate kinase
VDGTGIRAVLLGAPGSGKGTQAELLAGAVGVPAISTGDMLRSAVASGSPLGLLVRDVLASGGLVEDSLMAALVRERLAAEDAARGFILDGYPRTRAQADTLAGLLRERESALDAVVLLEVSEDALVRRLLGRGREDDREDVVRERLRLYHEKTEPVVSFYRERGLLRRVDGDLPIAEVTGRLLSVLAVSA